MEILSPEKIISLLQSNFGTPIIRVRGKVTKLSAYPETEPVCYHGILESMNCKAFIAFKCPADAAPQKLYDVVILEGKAMPNLMGCEVMLNGRCLNTDDSLLQTPVVQKKRNPFNRKINLNDFIEENSVSNVGICGNKADLNEFFADTSISRDEFAFTASVTLDDSSELFKHVRQQSTLAIIIVHSNFSEDIETWNQPSFVAKIMSLRSPFYVVFIGSYRPTLLEQYADQVFLNSVELSGALQSPVQAFESISTNVKSIPTPMNENIRKHLTATQFSFTQFIKPKSIIRFLVLGALIFTIVALALTILV